MDEATLCDRIALIQSGKVMSIDTPQDIVKAFPGDLYAIKSTDIYQLLKDIRSYKNAESCFAFGEYLHLTLKDTNSGSTTDLLGFLTEKNHKDLEIKKIEPTIEDCFIRLSS
jgi:ABC-type multidrug transport system ATPase subunit